MMVHQSLTLQKLPSKIYQSLRIIYFNINFTHNSSNAKHTRISSVLSGYVRLSFLTYTLCFWLLTATHSVFRCLCSTFHCFPKVLHLKHNIKNSTIQFKKKCLYKFSDFIFFFQPSLSFSSPVTTQTRLISVMTNR